MDISWIKGLENDADMFTKNLDGPAFERCIKTWMVQAWVGHFVTPLKCTYDEYD